MVRIGQNTEMEKSVLESFSKGLPGQESFEFVVLNGPTYTQNDRPPSWRNESSLIISRDDPPDLENAPLADFPLIEDFEVRLEEFRESGKSWFGYHLFLFSRLRGYIAGFPWWDHAERDLARDDFRIPLGDFEHPYSDIEQGWEIVIATKDDIVYVLEGDFDTPVDEGYHTWFKVDKGVYLSEWEKAIALCRAFSNE
jgi:hypothetical protein